MLTNIDVKIDYDGVHFIVEERWDKFIRLDVYDTIRAGFGTT